MRLRNALRVSKIRDREKSLFGAIFRGRARIVLRVSKIRFSMLEHVAAVEDKNLQSRIVLRVLKIRDFRG